MRAQSRPKSKYRRTVQMFILAVFVIALGMLIPKVFSFVSQVVMYPIHSVNIWLEESSDLIPTFIRDRKSLEEEIESLKNEIIVSGKTSLTQRRVIEENNRLRSLLGAETEPRVAAAIISRPNELPYDLLQIDRGSKHGIEVGSPVFIGEDIVIGLVAHVAHNYSFIQLVTAPGFEASAFIVGPNVVATLEGMGGGVARVKVPQGIPLNAGNLVYLPTIEPGVYGRIALVENEPTQPEQFGYISPEIPISGLFQVSVGKQSQISKSVSEVDFNILNIINQYLVVPELNQATTSTTTVEVTDSE